MAQLLANYRATWPPLQEWSAITPGHQGVLETRGRWAGTGQPITTGTQLHDSVHHGVEGTEGKKLIQLLLTFNLTHHDACIYVQM